MEFIKHTNLEGLHAPFSASQSSWLRYDDEKATEVYLNKKSAQMGTILHDWAKRTIDLGIKQPKSKQTIYAYVNDAIGFKMSCTILTDSLVQQTPYLLETLKEEMYLEYMI